jgi:hypothetical protein
METSDAIQALQEVEKEELIEAICEVIHYSEIIAENPVSADSLIEEILKYYREYYGLEMTDDSDMRKMYNLYLANKE